MSSQRLPGKVLLPFRGSTVLKFLYDKCKIVSGIKKVVVLTSKRRDDDEIERLCIANNMLVFRGSLSNVLERFQDAAKFFCKSDDYVIRLCADSPLIDQELLSQFANTISSKAYFYSTRILKNNAFFSTTGKGNNIDAIRVFDLLKLRGETELIREHIIYGFDYNENFNLFESSKEYCDDICIDTLADYQRLS